MTKLPIKILFWLVGVLLLLLIASVIVIPLAIDPNDYKELLITKVEEQTGRDFKIKEKISLSIFPWISPWAELEAGGLELSDNTGLEAKPLVKIERITARIRLIPLLSKRLEIISLELKGMDVYLTRDAHGVGNWQDILSQHSQQTETMVEDNSAAYSEFSLEGLEIHSASLEWDDRAAGQHVRFEDINVTTGSLGQGESLDFKLDFTVLNLAVSSTSPQHMGKLKLHAKVLFDVASREVRLDHGSISLEIPIKDGEFLAKLNIKDGTFLQQQNLNIEHLNLIVKHRHHGLNRILELNTAVMANRVEDLISLEKISISTEMVGGPVSGQAVKANLSATLQIKPKAGTLRLDQIHLSSDSLQINGSLKASDWWHEPVISGKLEIAPFNARQWLVKHGIAIPEMAASSTLTKVSAEFALKGTIGSAGKIRVEPLHLKLDNSQLSGFLVFQGGLKQFGLTLDQIDLDRYLPPTKGKEIKEARASNQPTAEMIPVELLYSLEVEGELKIGELTVKQLHLEQVKINLKAASGKVQVESKIGAIYQGTYQGQMEIDVTGDTPQIAMVQQLQGVEIGPLLTALTGGTKLLGKGNFSTDITTSGKTEKALRQALNGNVTFKLHDGAIKDFNLAQVIRTTYGAFSGKVTKTKDQSLQTDFTEIGGSARLTAGVLHNRDLTAKSPLIRVSGSGTMDLVEEKINYTVIATLVNSLQGQGGIALEQLASVPIPVNIKGSFAKLQYNIDWKKILLGSKKEELREKLQKALGDKVKIHDIKSILKLIF